MSSDFNAIRCSSDVTKAQQYISYTEWLKYLTHKLVRLFFVLCHLNIPSTADVRQHRGGIFSVILTYLHGYVCVQWSRLFQSWSRLVLGSQTVPPKNLHFLIVAECSLTGSEQRQPLDCAPPRPRRHTGRLHVHVVLARCCQSGLRVHHWEWGCCRLAPPVHRCQWTARFGGHTV